MVDMCILNPFSFHNPIYFWAIKIRRLRWAGHVARMKEGSSTFKILTDKPTGKPRERWEDNARINLKEIGVNKMNLIDSVQDRDYWRVFVNVALNLRIL